MKKGFTLVEVAVSVALFAILAYAGTTFFIQAVRDSNKVAVENEVRETVSGIMSDIATEVKGLASQTVSAQYCVARTISAPLYTVYISDSPANTPNCAANYTRRVTYVANSTTGVFTKQVQTIPVTPTSAVQLNSSRAIVAQCPLGSGGCSLSNCTTGFIVNYDSADLTPTLNVRLFAQQVASATRSDFCARTDTTQTITPRIRP